jgi:hypothetical protein
MFDVTWLADERDARWERDEEENRYGHEWLQAEVISRKMRAHMDALTVPAYVNEIAEKHMGRWMS